jgi:hypothetical protein
VTFTDKYDHPHAGPVVGFDWYGNQVYALVRSAKGLVLAGAVHLVPADSQAAGGPKVPPALPWTWGQAELAGDASGMTARAFGTPHLWMACTETGPRVRLSQPGHGETQLDADPAELVRWCREVLAALGQDTGMAGLPEWRPVTSGQGKRPWYVARYSGADDMRVPQAQRYHYAASGNLVRYASQQAAQAAADTLNAADGWTREQQDIEAVTENWRHCRICGDSWDWQPLDRCPSTHRHPLTQVKQAG